MYSESGKFIMSQQLLLTPLIKMVVCFRTLHVLVPLNGLFAVTQVPTLLLARGQNKMLAPIVNICPPLVSPTAMFAHMSRAPFDKSCSTENVLVPLSGPLRTSLLRVIMALVESIILSYLTPVVLVPSLDKSPIVLLGNTLLGRDLLVDAGPMINLHFVPPSTLECSGEFDVSTSPTPHFLEPHRRP